MDDILGDYNPTYRYSHSRVVNFDPFGRITNGEAYPARYENHLVMPESFTLPPTADLVLNYYVDELRIMSERPPEEANQNPTVTIQYWLRKFDYRPQLLAETLALVEDHLPQLIRKADRLGNCLGMGGFGHGKCDAGAISQDLNFIKTELQWTCDLRRMIKCFVDSHPRGKRLYQPNQIFQLALSEMKKTFNIRTSGENRIITLKPGKNFDIVCDRVRLM